MIAARIYKAKDLRIEDICPQKIQSGDGVRVKIDAAGICGSDLHVYQTGAYLTRTPVTMGHEFSGRVMEVGEDVDGFKAGDHVVGDSRVVCGACEYCRAGKVNLCESLGFLGEVCEGAFAGQIILPAKNLIRIDAGVRPHIGALAEPLAVALHAVNLSCASNAKRILILGAGPIGALIHTVLRIRGKNDLTVTDRSEYRCRAIKDTGCDSRVTQTPEGRYDLIFETTGACAVLQQIVPKALGRGGQAVLVGLFAKENPFNFTDIVEHEWDIKGCNCFSDELPAAVDLLEKYPELFDHVVSHQLPVAKAQFGFDLLLAPEKPAMKIVLTPETA